MTNVSKQRGRNTQASNKAWQLKSNRAIPPTTNEERSFMNMSVRGVGIAANLAYSVTGNTMSVHGIPPELRSTRAMTNGTDFTAQDDAVPDISEYHKLHRKLWMDKAYADAGLEMAEHNLYPDDIVYDDEEDEDIYDN